MRRLRKWVKVTGAALLFGVPCTILYNTGVFAEATPAQSLPKTNIQTLQAKSADTPFAEFKDKTLQKMYLLQDSVVYADSSDVSTTTQTVKKGDTVSVVDVDGEKIKVITGEGKQGYVNINSLTSNQDLVFADAKKTMYAKQDGVVVKASPYKIGSDLGKLKKNDAVVVTGTNSSGYTRVSYQKKTGYVQGSLLMKEKDLPKLTPTPVVETPVVPVSSWSGRKLSPSAGSVIGPSGKETYYNLDMSGCVNVMRRMGNSDQYWVRGDGVKMLGNYVMCAANLNVHPRGSLVESSVGTAIVVDTGGFAVGNPNQLDIAVNW